MNPTNELKHEHEAIKRMLTVITRVANRLDDREPVPVEDLHEILDFIRGFADACHHGKEEGILFPALVAAGIPRERGPVGVMLAEHETGRATVRRMASAAGAYADHAGDAGAEFAAAARDYVTLLAHHIHKEDNILFPMADARLDPDELEAIGEEFEAFERDVTGPDQHRHYHSLLHHLEHAYA